jgi:hypothetical protein
MRQLPQWEWPTILILQAAFAIACSVITNLIEHDLLGLIIGILAAPLTAYLLSLTATGFFFYLFMFAFKRDLKFRQIYIHVLFASIPVQIVATVAHLLPPLLLIASAAALMLLFVGFVENFNLPRRPLRNVLLGLFAIHVLYWGFLQVRYSSKHKILHQNATPESLDILEKELNE